MRLGIMLGYSGEGFAAAVDELVEHERSGVEIVAVPEAYSFDAVSQLGFVAARTTRMELTSGIVQLYSRTPTLTAMTAAGLDYVSGGRFSLGLGASGPQVVEGFHGVPYDAPLARTREIVEICRQVWRREPVVHSGRHYRVPLPPGAGTGLGKPLKLINHPVRPRIPVILAAVGPRSVAMTAEIAEGWWTLFFHPERAASVWAGPLADGTRLRDPALGPLDVLATVPFAVTDDPGSLLDAHRAMLALYIGGMGARERNFSNELVRRYGYEREAALIQDHFLSGRRAEAMAAVPDDLVRSTALVGPAAYVKDRLAAYAAAGVTTLLVSPLAPTREARLAAVRQLRDLV
ncbi:LLM class F420-dependent oxidoreductase [Virgisporangium ochraceum]|uniref:LLM class F420-dependent oxidoreductase n=1 Tax=Virgisporangium ochraceum TaxID=65505 RepID=A0A8J4EGC4_9ACTN|nr:LLM class F420-dependent oxidoreductase [Virgisporangium ochraceum]GIJ70992.1 LLM class F420-dependent oxidoreductase [Virgisporangium ochraceum]